LNELFDAKGIVAHDLDFLAQGGDLAGVLTGLPDVKATVSLWVIEGDLVTLVGPSKERIRVSCWALRPRASQ
jgi:hypothetical protein